MSLRGVIESRLRVCMAGVVIAFAAVFSCGAMALGSVVVFLRSGVVRVNCMGVFIHKTLISDSREEPGSHSAMHAGGHSDGVLT